MDGLDRAKLIKLWGEQWGDLAPFRWEFNDSKGSGVMLTNVTNSTMGYLSEWHEVAEYLNLLQFMLQHAEGRLRQIDALTSQSYIPLT